MTPRHRTCWLLVSILTPVLAYAQTSDPGRLFFTPAERTQIERLRSRPASTAASESVKPPAALTRYDGLVVRSDGYTTRWVNGQPRTGAAPDGLKPGQLRAHDRVYEAYQILPPAEVPEP